MKTLRSILFYLFLGILLPSISAAQLINAPQSSTTGSYTVSVQSCPGQSQWCELVELNPSGQNTTLAYFYPQSSTSVSITGRSPGTYQYYVVGYWSDGYGLWPTEYARVSVVVSGGVAVNIPRVELQEEVAYLAKKGDANGDGITDLYISRADASSPDNGTLATFILLRNAAGQFSVAAHTASQASSTAASWTPITAKVRALDVNLDYFADLLVSGLAADFPGAIETILFASGQNGRSSPSHIRPIDNNLRKFISDSERWALNPQYFESVAPVVAYPVYGWVYYCQYVYQYERYQYICLWRYMYLGTVLAYDFSSFSSGALAIKQQYDASNGGLTASGAANVKQTLQNQFGVPFGMGLSAPYPGAIDVPWPDTSDAYRSPWLLKLLKRWIVFQLVLELSEHFAVPILHYTDAAGVGFILSSGLINPPNSPLVYLTYDVYATSNMTRNCLSLDKMPVAAFVLDPQTTLSFVTVWSVVPPLDHPDGSHTTGGGYQTTRPKPLPIVSSRMPQPRYFNIIQDAKVSVPACVRGG
jgi:hypothetical protein